VTTVRPDRPGLPTFAAFCAGEAARLVAAAGEVAG
jgi:hypothetical protein